MTSSAGKMALATLPILAASVLAALAGGTAAPASAETYPDRMIKIVVPFTPGGPDVLVVDPALPVRSVGEFVAHAKARPGTLNYGSSGYGNATHLSAEWFKSKTGIDIVHVPYKGLSDALTGLIGGQVAMVFGAIEGVRPLMEQGKLRPLAVTTASRFPAVPDLPTMIESGVACCMATSFVCRVAPAGRPDSVDARLNAVINESVA